jgi:putative acetyltransferase
MPESVTIRRGDASDHKALGQLMYDAVHLAPSHYSEDQRQAWMPEPRSGPEWDQRLSSKTILIAEENDIPLSFMTIEPGGYIDFAYIRREAQGSGLFRRLYSIVETTAKEWGESALWVHASLMAQPAFTAMGFAVDYHETVEIGDQTLNRAHMTKII